MLGAANRPMAGKGVRQCWPFQTDQGRCLNKKEMFWQRPERNQISGEEQGTSPKKVPCLGV